MTVRSDELEKPAQRLREAPIAAREAADLEQTEFGKAPGRAQTFVSKDERGQRKLGVPEFIQIVRAPGVEPVEMLEPAGG